MRSKSPELMSEIKNISRIITCKTDNPHQLQAKELTINLRHIMNFGKDAFEAKILNTGQVVHNMKEFVEIAGEYV